MSLGSTKNPATNFINVLGTTKVLNEQKGFDIIIFKGADMRNLDIIEKWGIPSIIVTIMLTVFNFVIKKRYKDMIDRQENLERYFKPLSLSYGFGEYVTQIPDKDLNYYTLKPFQLMILQGDIKTYSIYNYLISKRTGKSYLKGGQPTIPTFEKIKHEQNSKGNYARLMNCIPDVIEEDIYEFELLDNHGNPKKVEMFSYYTVFEDYTGKYDCYLIIYILDKNNHSMTHSYVIDKFSSLVSTPFNFVIEGLTPTQECAEEYYETLSRFSYNYQDLRNRVKENF